jgi:hypothetical protein
MTETKYFWEMTDEEYIGNLNFLNKSFLLN